MPLVCLGLSHRTAPVEVRERHAFPASRMSESLAALHEYDAVREAVMLQTCNRLEIYAEVDDYETGVDQLRTFLRNFRHGSVELDIESYLYTLLGAQAVEHLMRVSTGLDSMLIGEAEVLGQVKDAYVQAQGARSLGKTLHALFREALAAGKAARSQTGIGGESTSVATAAIELAKQRVGALAGKTVLVLGAGKMGSLAARRLRGEGCAEVILANRSRARATALATELGYGASIDLAEAPEALERADIVVTSTGSPHFVVKRDHVQHAMEKRPKRSLFIVDIAVPRDVDPEAADIPGVTLADIDALKGLVEVTLERRRAAIPMVEEIVAEHAARFAHWYQARVAIPVVASLMQKAEAIRAAEIERLFARCGELSERERMLITNASLTIISRFLHGAVTRLRDRAGADRAETLDFAKMLDELFDLRLRAEEHAAAHE